MGISLSSFSVLEISRPTRMDFAFSAFMISATPFARTMTLETENPAVESIEIAETSFSVIVWLLKVCEVPHAERSNGSIASAIKPIFFTGIVCQFF